MFDSIRAILFSHKLRDVYREGNWKSSIYSLHYIRLCIRQMQMQEFLMPHQDSCGKKYLLSICTIFKDEAPYIVEWLEHHMKIGVEHFYMYNNNSSDDYLDKLQPYIDKGFVTLIDWPVNYKQLDAYEDCIKRYSDEAKWIGFIDLDEFVMLREDVRSLQEILEGFQKEYPSVFLNWKNYGSSGHISRDLSVPVVKDFTQCREFFSVSGKVFFNTLYEFKRELQRSFHHCLQVAYQGRIFTSVNLYGKPVFRVAEQFTDDDFPKAWINHYRIKSLEEFKSNRMVKGDVFYEVNNHNLHYFEGYDSLNTSSNSIEYAKRMEFLKHKNSMKKKPGRRIKAAVKKVLGKRDWDYLTEEDNDRSDTDYSFDEKIAVYTCIIGSYDTIYEPVVAPENIDYYIVTDQEVPASSRWKKIDANQFEDIKNLSAFEKNRFFKMHPHVVFPDYNYSIYIDGNIKIVTDFSEHMNRLSSVGFSTFKHHRRDSVYDEIDACIEQHKAPKEELLAYREKLLKEKFPGSFGLATCNIIAREHHKDLCVKIMDDWWNEYRNFVHRDQVALPRVLKNNGIKMEEVTVLGINEYKDLSFIIEKHKDYEGCKQ